MQTMQNAQPVNANLQMQVTLEAQQWNQILGVLGDAPYRIAAPLIQVIGEQLQSQANAQDTAAARAQAAAAAGQPLPNGPMPTFPVERA